MLSAFLYFFQGLAPTEMCMRCGVTIPMYQLRHLECCSCDQKYVLLQLLLFYTIKFVPIIQESSFHSSNHSTKSRNDQRPGAYNAYVRILVLILRIIISAPIPTASCILSYLLWWRHSKAGSSTTTYPRAFQRSGA